MPQPDTVSFPTPHWTWEMSQASKRHVALTKARAIFALFAGGPSPSPANAATQHDIPPQPVKILPDTEHDGGEVFDRWLPIETAPKDGKDILFVTRLCLVRLGFWNTARGGVWSIWPGREREHPTYWMPLPPPPRTGGEG